jgi:hypothetical protein
MTDMLDRPQWARMTKRQRDEVVTRMMADGYTYAQIAAEHGTTRGAIAGTANRAGIKAPERSKAEPRPVTIVKPESPPAATVAPVAPIQRMAPAPRVATPPLFPSFKGAGPRPLLSLSAFQCRYPLFDSAKDAPAHKLMACADPVKEGSVYCPHHHAKCHTREAPRSEPQRWGMRNR